MGGRSVIVAGTPPKVLRFEWDPNKSASNKTKHGVDFDEATIVWRDPRRVTIPSAYTAEPRLTVTGYIGDRMYTVVTTMRNDVIRIISARRATWKEASRHGSVAD